MANHTSLRVGGWADLFFVARGSSPLIQAVDMATALGVPWHIVGAGSNLLISDDGVEGLVVKAASRAGAWQIRDEGGRAAVEAEAGCILASLARHLVDEGFEGLEWAVNVPGTVGAAVVNNAGAFGSSTSEHLIDAELYFPGMGRKRLTPGQLEMAYRTTALKRRELEATVLGASFRLRPSDKGAVRERMEQTQRQRQATQPTGPSLGSIFANPPGDAAGRLIEAAGLKGRRRGGAEVSTLHANFILNRGGGAQAREVFGLMAEVQDAVWRQHRHWLVPEVELVGRWREAERRALLTPPGHASARVPGTEISLRLGAST